MGRKLSSEVFVQEGSGDCPHPLLGREATPGTRDYEPKRRS